MPASKSPSFKSLLLTGIVALVLFSGIVVIAKRLPTDNAPETTGSAPVSDLPAPKASDRAPAKPDMPR